VSIGSEPRVIGQDFNEFVLARRSSGPLGKGGLNVTTNAKAHWVSNNLRLKSGSSFTHRWPDGTKERYRDVLEGSVTTKSGVRAVKIGFVSREAAGKDRERAAVFIDGRPFVEFCGADDFNQSKIMASIIKVNRRQVRPIEGVPSRYAHLKVDAYNKFITG